jgi:hypothetical protein
LRYSPFLDDATSRILLRRVGGGYAFIHRRLQDYFATATKPPVSDKQAKATDEDEQRPEHLL